MPEQVRAKQELDTLQEQLSDAVIQLRELAKRLRPPTLDELGFEASLRQLLSENRRQVKFDVSLEVASWLKPSNEAEIALYRIV